MSSPFVTPSCQAEAFNCPSCGAFSVQHWGEIQCAGRGFRQPLGSEWDIALCQHCSRPSIWYGGTMIVPGSGSAPLPNRDLPEDVLGDYTEAREILGRSPRAAAALLRLAIQKLCVHLGEKGKDLNKDIGELRTKGLLPAVQQALDAVRVIGNNAVHPGQIDLRDDTATVAALFGLVNLICEQMISGPRQAREVFDMLPQSAKDAIAKRDAVTT